MESKIKNKDQEPAILGQHQQEPALRAQGFYVHKVHKQAEIATNQEDQDLNTEILTQRMRMNT